MRNEWIRNEGIQYDYAHDGNERYDDDSRNDVKLIQMLRLNWYWILQEYGMHDGYDVLNGS